MDELGIPASIIKHSGSPPFNSSSTVTVSCACGTEAELKVSSVLRTMRRAGLYRCLSCGMKAKHQDPAYQEKHRSGAKESWSQERRERQSEISKRLWSDSEFRQKLTNASSEAWSDAEKRKQASDRSVELWRNDEFRAKHEQALAHPEIRQARADAAREMWERPGYAERQREVKASTDHVELQRRLAIERFENPEYRQHVSDSLKALWADNPGMREAMSARVSALWKDPAYLEKQARAAADPRLCALKSANAQRQWQNSVTRQALINGIANMLADGKDSILERTAQTLLNALGIPYVRHHVIGYFEFDLLIPSHNVLIECNGEYWHSLRKDKDAAKFSYIDAYFPEYRVLYLWERDFLNPNLIRHKLIRALFGGCGDTENQTDFAFGDLSIRKADLSKAADKSYYSPAEEFLQSFHYAGFGRSAKIAYGLYIGETLIGLCKFCSPVRNESATSMGFSPGQVLELDRFCIHPNYQKKNLASWFASRCAKLVFAANPGIASLISFADSTFGHVGTMYKAANWKQVHIVPPDYHYISPDGFVVHKKTLYDHASRNGSKEVEYASKFGYVKAYGKSKIKFRLDR